MLKAFQTDITHHLYPTNLKYVPYVSIVSNINVFVFFVFCFVFVFKLHITKTCLFKYTENFTTKK